MDLLINFHADKTSSNMDGSESIKLDLTHVIEIMEYVKRLEEERDEVENCNRQIKYLLNDIDVLEELYKQCVEEMMKQDTVISSLRRCYFEHREEEINWRTENTLLKSKLDNFNINSSQLRIEEDVEAIKAQLRDLQCLLTMEVTPIQIVCSRSNTRQSKTNKTLGRKLSRLKNKVMKQSAIIKHSNAIITQNELHLKDLRKTFIDKTDCVCLGNSIKTTEKIENIEKQFIKLTSFMETLQDSLKDSRDNCNQVTSQCRELLQSHIHMGDQMRDEHSTIVWLESELQESAMKGTEICCESKQIFGNLKNWLHLAKKERRVMLMKIKELRCVNKILLQRLNGTGVSKI